MSKILIYLLFALIISLVIISALGFFSASDLGYQIHAKQVIYKYRKHYDSPFVKSMRVDGADLQTFQIIQGAYAKDAKRVYFRGQVIEEADPETFQMLAIDAELDRDSRNVYYRGKLLSRDAENFEQIDARYFRDRQHVWMKKKHPKYISQHIFILFIDEGAEHFEKVGSSAVLTRTAQQVFYYDKEIPGVDPTQVKVLGGAYWRDQHRVYFESHALEQADVASFSVLGYPYAKDRSSVFYQGKRIEEADAKTFAPVAGTQEAAAFYFWDVARVYYKGEILPQADPQSFERIYAAPNLVSLYSKDKEHVYYGGELLPQAKAASFRLEKKGNLYIGDDGQLLFKDGKIYSETK